jgi:glutamate--cysteine ligase
MSTKVSGPEGPIISSRDELVAYLEQGSKPASAWRIGTEHEKFGFYRRGHGPVPMTGARHPRAA